MKTMKTIKNLSAIVLSIVLLSVVSTSCSKKEGCTDPLANNFDSEAQSDDGSCTYDATPEPEEHAESHLTFNFTHNFDGIPVTAANFNQFNFVTANGDTISITKLRYLISNIRLYTNSGDSVVLDGYQLMDVTNNTGLTYSPGEVEWGAYSAIGFDFGFDTVNNAGNYVDLNSASWNVPAMMGGGYHCMQFEGKYKLNGNDSTYAYHHIALTRPNMLSNFEQNNISVKLLGGVAFNQHYVSLNVQMNIAEWFKNPTTWDLNAFHTALMPNYVAQKMMQANGYNVFSLGSVTQKQ
jgi:hypothetical protein